MSVYILGADDENYKDIRPLKHVDLRFFDYEQGPRFRKMWTPIPVEFFDWMAEDQGVESVKAIPDLTIFLLDNIICNQKALKALSPLVDNNVELLPLEFAGGKLFLIEGIKILDCLDYLQSDYDVVNSRGVPFVRHYVFKDGCIGNNYLFRLPLISRIFVLDSFRTIVEANDLHGLAYQPVA